MRRVLSSALLALLLTPLFPVAADAANHNVQVGPTQAYDDADISIALNDTVTFNWPPGSVGHSVTSDDGFFNSGVRDGPNTYPVVFDVVGDYPYHCTVHGASDGVGMSGVVRVGTGSPSPSASPSVSLSPSTSKSPTPKKTTPPPTRTPTRTPTPTPTPTPTLTASPTLTSTPSESPSETPTDFFSPTDSEPPAVIDTSKKSGSGTNVGVIVAALVALAAFIAAWVLWRRSRPRFAVPGEPGEPPGS